MCVCAKITTVNNDNLDAADAVGPVNKFLPGLFSQVDLSLNGTLNTRSTITCEYRAYIETLLSYGIEAKSSQLTSALFYKDETGKMDKPHPMAANAVDRNSGLAKRLIFGTKSSEIHMIGCIHTDIFFD
jgi:hypothetical protein